MLRSQKRARVRLHDGACPEWTACETLAHIARSICDLGGSTTLKRQATQICWKEDRVALLSRFITSVISSRQSVSQAAVYLAAFTLLNKLLSVIQQILIGRVFGATADTDAFFIAQIIPLLLGGMVAVALTTSLIPILAQRQALSRGVLSGLVLALLGMLLLLSLSSAISDDAIVHVFGPGFNESTATVARRLLRPMSSLILLMGTSGIFTAFFYAKSRFLVPAAAACLLYIGGIGGIFLLKPWFGIDSLAWGLIVGGALQLLVLSLFVERSWLQTPVFEVGVFLQMLKTFLPIFLGLAISTLYLVIDRSFATSFPAGYVASFNFAGNLMTLPSQMVVVNITNALLPSLVLLKTRKGEFSELLGNALTWIGFLLVPATVVMLTWGQPLVRLLFHSESFGLDTVSFTSDILVAYSFAILGLALKDISTTALIALGRERLPMLIGFGSLLLSVLLKLILIPRLGHLAIAYSTDVASALNGLVLLLVLSQLLPLNWRHLLHLSGWKVLVAGSIMVVFWLLFRSLAPVNGGLTGWLYVLTAIGIYVLTCAALRLPELGALWGKIAYVRLGSSRGQETDNIRFS
jgi:putative peptidoglycan lipid II flippase